MKGKKIAGRKAGVPNKITGEVREAYKSFVENNIPNLELWMQRVAIKEPDKALDFMLKFSEYFIPKLNRTELTGKDEGSILVDWVIPKNDDSV